MRKIIASAVLCFQLLWWMPAEQAEAITQKPEPLRIPPVIMLLEDTPFYDNVEADYPNHPAGILSPQDVKVLEGQNGWVNERNRWTLYLHAADVQTLFGASLTKDDVGPVFFLAAKAYAIEPGLRLRRKHRSLWK